MQQRTILQICFVAVALVVIITGVLGMLGIDNPLYASVQLPREPLLDTNLRFYSGLWLGVGVVILATVRGFENHLEMYCLIWAMIFVGGVGRMMSLLTIGTPPFPIVGLMILELWGAPFLAYCQMRMSPGQADR